MHAMQKPVRHRGGWQSARQCAVGGKPESPVEVGIAFAVALGSVGVRSQIAGSEERAPRSLVIESEEFALRLGVALGFAVNAIWAVGPLGFDQSAVAVVVAMQCRADLRVPLPALRAGAVARLFPGAKSGNLAVLLVAEEIAARSLLAQRRAFCQ